MIPIDERTKQEHTLTRPASVGERVR
jgi:hypothetical protein